MIEASGLALHCTALAVPVPLFHSGWVGFFKGREGNQ